MREVVLSAPDVQEQLLFLCTPEDEVSFCPRLIIRMLPHVSLKAACFIATVRHCCSTLVCNYRDVSDGTKDVGLHHCSLSSGWTQYRKCVEA